MVRSKWMAIIAFIYLAVAVSVVESRYQRWIPNTHFDNPRNWRSGKVPCRNEHVRFPPSVASVFVQRNNTVMEIILPNDGEIILGQDVVLSFPSASEIDATCHEKETEYNGSTPMSWFSPDNWCEMSDADSENCLPAQPRRLHTESIPCAYDDVVFPSASGFIVDIASGVEIRINTLHIGSEPYTKRSLLQYLGTDAARRQFVRNSPGVDTTFRISGQNGCNDVSGCVCNNDQLKDKICEAKRSSCRQPICQNALSPHGHCCQICGAIMSLDFGSGFRIAVIENILKSLYQQPVTKRSTQDENVWWIVSKIETGTETIIQVVLADDGDGENAVKVAYKLKEELQKDMKGRRRYGVTHIEMQVSGTVDPNQDRHTGDDESAAQSNTTKVLMIIIMVLVMIIVGFIVLCLILRRRGQRIPVSRKQIQDTLARWLATGQGDSSDGSTHQAPPQVVEYINESYDKSAENAPHGEFIDLQVFGLEDVQPTDGAQGGGYNNPLYGNEPGVQEIVSQMSSRRPPSEPYVAEDSYENMQRFGRDQQPFSSKVAAAFKGLKPEFSSGRQRFDDENGNVKQRPEPNIEDLGDGLRKSGGKDGEVTDAVGQRKKRGKKSKKNAGGDRHQRLEESDASDGDESARRSGKAPAETNDKGFANPCYDTPESEQTTPQTQQQASPRSLLQTEQYRTGFANPTFEERSRHIEGAETGDSNV